MASEFRRYLLRAQRPRSQNNILTAQGQSCIQGSSSGLQPRIWQGDVCPSSLRSKPPYDIEARRHVRFRASKSRGHMAPQEEKYPPWRSTQTRRREKLRRARLPGGGATEPVPCLTLLSLLRSRATPRPAAMKAAIKAGCRHRDALPSRPCAAAQKRLEAGSPEPASPSPILGMHQREPEA